MTKKAFITGITGQDGAYLARLLLEKDYEVHGLKRRSSSGNTSRIDSLLHGRYNRSFYLHEGDMTDSTSLVRLIRETEPDEVYNLAAQSHVGISFMTPEFTGDVNGMGTLRLLEAIRACGMEKKTRFYQASTSELFGRVVEIPQTEKTPFYPRSPYAVAKLFAYWTTVNYREAYHLFACNGILFNHESPLRGDNFVTKKITRAAVRIHAGLQDKLLIGNLDSKRDWGHAADYVEGMWRMLQQKEPDDYILATGEVHSVREFVETVFSQLGFSLSWTHKGIEEKGIDTATGRVLVEVSPEFFRPTEVDYLQGDATKARTQLGWVPNYSFNDLVQDMLQYDLNSLKEP